LLAAMDDAAAPIWRRQVPALLILRRVWIQNYLRSAALVGWREQDNIPPASLFLSSPHDPTAH
jgi:transposase